MAANTQLILKPAMRWQQAGSLPGDAGSIGARLWALAHRHVSAALGRIAANAIHHRALGPARQGGMEAAGSANGELGSSACCMVPPTCEEASIRHNMSTSATVKVHSHAAAVGAGVAGTLAVSAAAVLFSAAAVQVVCDALQGRGAAVEGRR